MADGRVPLRRRVRARALAALVAGAGALPAPLVGAAAGGVTRLARGGPLGARTRANLALALGDETSEAERERIARGVFRHAARQVTEWLRLARGGAEWIDDAVQLDASFEHLERALARGRGAIVATAHLGNWELLAARLVREGVRGAVVARVRPRDPSHAFWARVRAAHGVRTLPQASAPRDLLEVLRSGGVLGLLSDLEVRRLDGEWLPFFGTPALTMTAPAALARASGAPLVPVRCAAPRDDPRGPYRLVVEEALELDASLPRAVGALELLRRLNACYEAWIRATPEQWAWHQARWRTPPGSYDPVPLAERRRRLGSSG